MGQIVALFGLNLFKRSRTHYSQLYLPVDTDENVQCKLQPQQCTGLLKLHVWAVIIGSVPKYTSTIWCILYTDLSNICTICINALLVYRYSQNLMKNLFNLFENWASKKKSKFLCVYYDFSHEHTVQCLRRILVTRWSQSLHITSSNPRKVWVYLLTNFQISSFSESRDMWSWLKYVWLRILPYTASDFSVRAIVICFSVSIFFLPENQHELFWKIHKL